MNISQFFVTKRAIAWTSMVAVLYVIFVEDRHLVRRETESVPQQDAKENRT
jgi:hypothetical protein